MARLESASAGKIASGAWARFIHDPEEARFVPEPAWRDLSGLEFLLLHYEAGWMMHPAAWLCPRSLLDQIGPWDERLSLNDDGEYFGRVVLASGGILFCPAAKTYYRSGLQDSLSRRKDPRAFRSLRLSTELNCERVLLAAGNSPRARAAAANGWKRLAFESFPVSPEITDEAEARRVALGGSPVRCRLARRCVSCSGSWVGKPPNASPVGFLAARLPCRNWITRSASAPITAPRNTMTGCFVSLRRPRGRIRCWLSIGGT